MGEGQVSFLRKSLMRQRLGALSLILVTVLYGCSSLTIQLKPGSESLPEVSRIPVVVGVYYSPELKTYRHEENARGFLFIRHLGQASTTLFDKVFALLFQETHQFEGLPPLAEGQQNVAAVIELRIETFDVGPPSMGMGRDLQWAEITYRFTTYFPEGDTIASWIITGTAEEQMPLFHEYEVMQRVTNRAIEDAGAKFLIGFQSVPENHTWLEQLGVLRGK